MSLLAKARPLVAARFISACVTVVVPLVLARLMSLPEYGTYKQLFLIAMTVYYVLPFGVAQSLYFFVPRAQRAEERRAYFGQTLLFLACAGVVAGALLYGLAEPISHALNNPALLEVRLSLAIYTACAIASFPLELSLTSQGKTKQSAVAYLVSDGLRALALTLPILLGLGVRGLMAAMVFFSIMRLGATWSLMLGSTRGKLWNGRAFLKQLAYAMPFGVAILFSIPQQYAHQFAVSASVSPELFAIYAVGCFQLPLVDLLYTPTSEVLMVRLGELEREGRAHESVAAFREAASNLAYAFLPLAAFLFAAAPEFITAVFGHRFEAAVPIFRVCVLGIPLAMLPLDGTLRARNQTGHILGSYVVKAAVTVPLVYFGVTRFGMLGGIGAWLVAEIIGKVTLLMRVPAALSTETVRVRLRELIPGRALGMASLGAVAAALAVALLREAAMGAYGSLPESFAYRLIPLAIAAASFGLGYLAVLWCGGVRPTRLFISVLRRRPA